MSQEDEKQQPGGATNGQPLGDARQSLAPSSSLQAAPAPGWTVTIPTETTAPVAPPSPPRLPPPRPVAMVGRRYGFLCSYCSSRLEAVESMAGQSGTCPTCGKSIVIPILDYRGRLIDPTSGQVIKQDPHPVHAYAAAGHKAPIIVAAGAPGERMIKCPRCSRGNALSANNCMACGLPFTMEGTVGDIAAGQNSWAVVSLVMGIISLPGGCLMVPPILAIIFGIIALRSDNQATGKVPGAGMAIAGIIMGVIGFMEIVLWIWRLHI